MAGAAASGPSRDGVATAYGSDGQQEGGVGVLSGVQGMIGETAFVTRRIEGTHRPGSIRARGEEWLAIPLDPNETIEPGTDVVVADVSRGLLVVYAAET